MPPLRAVAAVEALLLGAGIGVLALSPASGGAAGPGAARGEATEAPPAIAFDISKFELPDLESFSAQLELNTASQEDLAQFIGAGTARRLVEHREKSGPFQTLADIDAVHGIGEATLLKIAPHLKLNGVPLTDLLAGGAAGSGEGAAPGGAGGAKVNINAASKEELMTLPGVGEKTAERIIAGRPYATVDDLDNVKGIGRAAMERLRPLITAN